MEEEVGGGDINVLNTLSNGLYMLALEQADSDITEKRMWETTIYCNKEFLSTTMQCTFPSQSKGKKMGFKYCKHF